QRGPALLPHEPRPRRGRGHGDDRARLRRADRARAAHGVRARAQPADRAADGRSRRLMGLNEKPLSTLHEKASYDLADFEVPTGREEAWRFTPLSRLKGLHNGKAEPVGHVKVDVDAAPEVTVETVGRDDPRLGRVYVPSDRVSAQAYSAFEQATVLTVPREAVT